MSVSSFIEILISSHRHRPFCRSSSSSQIQSRGVIATTLSAAGVFGRLAFGVSQTTSGTATAVTAGAAAATAEEEAEGAAAAAAPPSSMEAGRALGVAASARSSSALHPEKSIVEGSGAAAAAAAAAGAAAAAPAGAAAASSSPIEAEAETDSPREPEQGAHLSSFANSAPSARATAGRAAARRPPGRRPGRGPARSRRSVRRPHRAVSGSAGRGRCLPRFGAPPNARPPRRSGSRVPARAAARPRPSLRPRSGARACRATPPPCSRGRRARERRRRAGPRAPPRGCGACGRVPPRSGQATGLVALVTCLGPQGGGKRRAGGGGAGGSCPAVWRLTRFPPGRHTAEVASRQVGSSGGKLQATAGVRRTPLAFRTLAFPPFLGTAPHKRENKENSHGPTS